MAVNINVQGTLYPAVAAQPTHDEQYGKGGYRTVQTETERNNIKTITPNYLSDGCLVFVRDDLITYQYNESLEIWQVLTINGDSIADGSITEIKLNDNSVSWRCMQNNSVGSNEIADNSVTYDKLATDITNLYYTKGEADGIFMPNWTSEPLTNDAAGVRGDMAYGEGDGSPDWLYLCLVGSVTAGTSGVWVRTELHPDTWDYS